MSPRKLFFLTYSATSILAFTCAFLVVLILSLVFVPAVAGTFCVPGSGWLTLSRNILASWHLHHQFHFPPSSHRASTLQPSSNARPRLSSIFFLWLYFDIS